MKNVGGLISACEQPCSVETISSAIWQCLYEEANANENGCGIAQRRADWTKKIGQPFRITQSQLREVVLHIGLLALKIKPYFNNF
jgi:hypothetical protein